MTTIELEPKVSQQLVEVARREGVTPGAMLGRLLEMHDQQMVLVEYERLQADESEWRSYTAEREQFEHAALTDFNARIDDALPGGT